MRHLCFCKINFFTCLEPKTPGHREVGPSNIKKLISQKRRWRKFKTFYCNPKTGVHIHTSVFSVDAVLLLYLYCNFQFTAETKTLLLLRRSHAVAMHSRCCSNNTIPLNVAAGARPQHKTLQIIYYWLLETSVQPRSIPRSSSKC